MEFSASDGSFRQPNTYVLVVPQVDIEDAYFFVGPFATDIDACAWGEQQDDVHPCWHVLELENPRAKPRILPPTIRPFASGRVGDIIPPARGERGRYILSWTLYSQYHLIGPFGDQAQCRQFIDYDSDRIIVGPYGDPNWYVLLLYEPPLSPRVEPPAILHSSPEEMRRRRLKLAEEDAFLDSLCGLGDSL